MTNGFSIASAMIICIALSITSSAICFASDDEQDVAVKLLLLSSDNGQSDLQESLASELLLTFENISFKQMVVDASERREWGDSHDRIMRKIYALGLLEDAQVVIDLTADDNNEPALLLMVLFEKFAVGTVEKLGSMDERPDELALICRALMIEAGELFTRGSTAEDIQLGDRADRWMQFSVLSDLPREETPTPEAPEPKVTIEPISLKIVRPLMLMPYFAFESGLVGHKGSSSWLGGGLQLQLEITTHWVMLADLAAKGGSIPQNTKESVEGFRIDPAIGTAGRWFAGPLRFLVLAQLLASFSHTTLSKEGLQSTSSFHFVPGLKAGLMIRWQLSDIWSLCLAGSLNWFWKRWGYRDESQNVELYSSPWLEISTLLGVGYHF